MIAHRSSRWSRLPIQAKGACCAIAVEDRILVVMTQGLGVLLVRFGEVVFSKERVTFRLELVRFRLLLDRHGVGTGVSRCKDHRAHVVTMHAMHTQALM